MIKFIALDIDGVIYSSENFLHEAYQIGIKNFVKDYNIKDIKIPQLKDIINLVGQTYKIIISTLFPDLEEELKIVLRNYVLDALVNLISNKKGILLEGVYEFLKFSTENKYLIGTASNGSSTYCEAVLETYNISKYFNERVYVDFINFNDKADILDYYIDKYNLKNDELLFIGDRLADVNAAKKVNCLFIGISGHGSEDELKDANIVVNNLREAVPFIINFKKEELCLKNL
ncbi:MAG: HAD hydrolase-like protein [Spirochaetes bacterium]|nr:HAD hydrolase-like protein [Spirochaetota bacterium]